MRKCFGFLVARLNEVAFTIISKIQILKYFHKISENRFSQEFSMYCKTIFEPQHEISNNVVFVTSKGSDQPAHTHSLIRAFAGL